MAVQRAFSVGARQAHEDAASSTMSRVISDQAWLATALRGAVPVAKLHRAALRFLGPAYAIRRVRMMDARMGKGGTIDLDDASAVSSPGALGAVPAALSGSGSVRQVVSDRSAEAVLGGAAAPRRMFGRMTGELGDVAKRAGSGRRIEVDETEPRPLSRRVKPSVRLEAGSYSPRGPTELGKGVSADGRGGVQVRRDMAAADKNSIRKSGFASESGGVTGISTSDDIINGPKTRDRLDRAASYGMSANARVAPRFSANVLDTSTGAFMANRASGAGAEADAGGFRAVSANGVDSTTGSQSSPAGQSGAVGGLMGGDVFLDGALVGRWISRLLTRDAERASVGRTGFDVRRGRLLPGPTVGGP